MESQIEKYKEIIVEILMKHEVNSTMVSKFLN